MDWLSVLSAALAGALAAAIASLLFLRKLKNRRVSFAVITLLLLFLLQAFSNQVILPRVREWQVDQQLKELPFYRDIAEVDPQTYEKMRIVVSDSVRKGDRADSIASHLSPIVTASLPKYIGTASDDSVIALVDVIVRKVDELRLVHSDACYYLLFPHENGAPPMSSYLDEKSAGEVIETMGRIVHSAVHAPQPLPDATKAEEFMVPVADRLRNEYGDDLLLLQKKPSDSLGRQKVCAITVSMYKDVEGLPRSNASLLLRYLLSNQASQ